MASIFDDLRAKVAALPPKEGKSRKKTLLDEDHTLDEIIPRTIVTKDSGRTRYMVKQQNKQSIGNRSTPKVTWVQSVLLLNLSGSGELLVSIAQWKDNGWSVLDYQF